MGIRIALAVVFALGALNALSPNARAETPEERQACMNDAYVHCGEAIPNRERVYQCLVRKQKTISPACRKALNNPSNQRS